MRFGTKQRLIVEMAPAAPKAEGPKPKPALETVKEILAMAVPYVMPLLMFFIGYVFSESVKQDSERRKLAIELPAKRFEIFKDFSSDLKARKEDKLTAADLEKLDAFRALALADMGDEGVRSLIFLQSEDSNSIRRGILHAAALRPVETCAIFRGVLGSRRGAYSLSAHKRILENVERVECADMGGTLQGYVDEMEDWFVACHGASSGKDCGRAKLRLGDKPDATNLCDLQRRLLEVSDRLGVVLARRGAKSLTACGI